MPLELSALRHQAIFRSTFIAKVALHPELPRCRITDGDTAFEGRLQKLQLDLRAEPQEASGRAISTRSVA